MNDKNLDTRRIFEMVRNKEITAEEAFNIINNISIKETITPNVSDIKSEILYYGCEWEQESTYSQVNLKERNNILIFTSDYFTIDNCNEVTKYSSINIKTVKVGNKFTKINDNEFTMNPEDENDYTLLFLELINESFYPEQIVNLWTYNNIFKENLNIGNENELLTLSIYSIFHTVRAFSKLKIKSIKRFLVGLDNTNYKSNPFSRAIKGFNESFSISLPSLLFQTIELSSDNIIETILKEINISQNIIHRDIRYDNGNRYIRKISEIELEKNNNIKLKKNGVYIITGGTGGLGQVFASYLAEKYSAKLILTGRSKLDDKRQKIIDGIKKRGGEVLYLQADVGSTVDMQNVINISKKEFGNINGILHTSGLNSITGILKKEFKEFKNILWPKIQGTIVLDEVTKNENIDFLLLFSSVASALGDFGQGDYAVSNRFLDEFIKYREDLRKDKKRKGITKAIGWPLWRNGGMHLDEDVELLYLQSSGLVYLEDEDGFTILEKVLASNINHTIIFKGDREKIKGFIASKNKGSIIKKHNRSNKKIMSNIKKGMDINKRIELDVINITSEILKLDVSKISIDENISDFGFDSIALKELADRLCEHYNIELSPVIFFDLSTLKELRQYLVNEHKDEIISIYAEYEQKESGEEYSKEDFQENVNNIIDVQYRDFVKEKITPIIRDKEPVAIIGVSGILPGSNNIEEFWENLEQQKDSISEIPIERWDWKQYYNNSNRKHDKFSKWGGFIEGIEQFDAKFFNISPKEAELMDPQQRLFIQTVWRTIEDAGYKASNISGKSVGVFVGVQPNEYQHLISNRDEIQPQGVTGNANSLIANRISFLLNLRGPSESIDTACSSSLIALNRGVKSIQNGESEMAIAGGVSLMISPNVFIGAIKLGVLSPDGRCKTFDKSANGYVRGEGVGSVLLKPLSKAIEDKDNIYAIIKGTAEGHGGKANSLTAPNSDAQASLLLKAYEDACIKPETITYIEAHGTGTELGDPVEIQGLKKVFKCNKNSNGKYIGLGSVKTNIGHLEPASGIAGLVKVILSMKYKKLPGLLHYKELNPLIDLNNTPFHIIDKTIPWKTIVDNEGNTIPRRAGISSFGFGGAYAHAILEEYDKSNIENYKDQHELIVLSAKTEKTLKEYATNLMKYLENKLNKEEYINLTEIAYTLQVGRESMKNRLAIITNNIEDLIKDLHNYINGDYKNNNLFIGDTSNMLNYNTLLDGDKGAEFLKGILLDKELDKLAMFWLNGVEINWEILHKNNKPQKISLPTYPFAKDCYWIQKEEEKEISSVNIVREPHQMKAVQEQLEETIYYSSAWEKSDIYNNNNSYISRLLIFALDDEIVSELKSKVEEVIVVKQGKEYKKISNLEYEISSKDIKDYIQLMKSLKEDDKQPTQIIHLWSDKKTSNNIGYLREKINISANSLYALSHAIIKEKLENRVKIIYTYNNKEIQPEYEAVSGLLKTVCLENSKIGFKSINLSMENKKEIVKILYTELDEESTEVMYKSGQRYIKKINEVNVIEDKSLIKKEGVYVITGGLGGLGFIFAKHLAKNYNAKLVLTGRSVIDSKKELKIKELKDCGSEVIYFTGDISSKEEVEELVKITKEKYIKINGIIHSAGVIKDSYIINKTLKDMEEVILPKVYGTVLLDEATKDEHLDFFVMFSSVTAILGNVGQADYAYGNSFMDSFAKQREIKVSNKERFGKSISINWPLWRQGGMQVDSETEKFIESSYGFKLLETNKGIKAFELSLMQNNNQFMVLDGYRQKIDKILDSVNKEKIVNLEKCTNSKVDKDILVNKLKQDVILIVSEILKINEKEIDLDENMSEFGFDSLSFTEFSNKLNDKYNIDIIPAIFYEHVTLMSLITYIVDEENELIAEYYSNQINEDELIKKEVLAINDSYNTNTVIKKRKSKDEIKVDRTISKLHNEPIAIVGISGVMPGANNLNDFWNNLEAEQDMITEIPKGRWDWKELYGNPLTEPNKTNIKWGGFITDVDKFDASFFGISEKEAILMDPQQRIFLETAWKAIEDAGYSQESISDTNTGVFVGVGVLDYGEVVNKIDGEIHPQISTGMSNSMVPNRVSYLLNLRGPSEPIDTACASSLSAIHRAVQEIQLGNCDMAIAGGIKLILSPTLYIAFSKAGMLSEDGKCKTFDKDANGYVRGEGSGAILLKPLRKAIEDNNNIYAVIKGTAINHGGHVNSLTTPSPNAQAEVIIKAWEKANVNPSTVGYIETYGSGTSLGDTIEINGLKKAFKELNNNWGNDNLKSKYCGIGSVKTNIGHLETASGIAGLLKVILAMKNKKLPASINYNEINPYIKLEDSPFYIVENTNKWDKKENEPRRAGVSAFGHGGVNAHIALEEYVAPIMNELDSKDSQIIVLSAKNKDRLKEYVREMIKYIDNTFGNNVDSNIYEETLMNNILNDLKQIVSKTLEVSPNDISVFEEMDTYGFEPLVISEFLQIVSETFKIEKMTLHTNGYTSLKNIANCLLNNYRQNIINYYSNSIIENNCVRSNIYLKDMAYTLQVGRDGMNERLAVVVNNIEDLKKKLTMFLEGKKNIDNLYIGTIKGNKVNKKTIELMDGEEGKEFVNLLIKNNKLKKISQLWVTGIEINWEKLNENSNKKRISLPTYPFAKDSYWVTKGEK